MSKTEPSKYNRTARFFHWVVAGMIVLQFVLAKLAERADAANFSLKQLALLANHKSVGITILALVVLRLLWRLLHSPPTLPASMPRWQIHASNLSHAALYLLIIAMPISGWLMSSASAYSVSWFNLFVLPDLISPGEAMKTTLKTIHDTMAKVLLALAALHILAALKHAIIDKDGVLGRMTSTLGIVLFAAVIASGVSLLNPTVKQAPGDNAGIPATRESANTNQEFSLENEQPSSLPAWKINYGASYIRFQGSQAGAAFTGAWPSWTATIQFSEDVLDEGNFEVTVTTSDVDTQDGERDATLMEADWFNTQQYPNAVYQSSRFEKEAGKGFRSSGTLTIKGRATPVTLMFDYKSESGKQTLQGSANLLRLQHALGAGEWQDTDWIGNEVMVEFYVESE